MGQYLSDKNNYVPSSKDSHKFEIPWYLFLKYVKFGNFGTYEKHYSLFPLFSNVREGRGSTLINWFVCDEQTQSLIFQLFFFFVYHLQMQCFLVVLAVYTKKKFFVFVQPFHNTIIWLNQCMRNMEMNPVTAKFTWENKRIIIHWMWYKENLIRFIVSSFLRISKNESIFFNIKHWIVRYYFSSF